MSTLNSYRRSVIRLRPATGRDVAAILELEIACFSRTEEMFGRRQLRGLIVNPRAIVVVAESKDRILGWSAGLMRRHRGRYSGRLYAIAVHPDAQGKRIGQKLIGHILHSLAVRGAQRIFLEVHTKNQKAINLYHKFGFTDQQHLSHYYGQGHHGLRMMRQMQLPISQK